MITTQNVDFKTDPDTSGIFQHGLLSVLKETKFLEHFNNLIECAVLFAKNVPYFMNIHETDRISLLKSCVFEIILVRHATCFSSSYSPQLTANNQTDSLGTLAAVAAASTSSVTELIQKSRIMKTLDSDSVNQHFFESIFFWLPACEMWMSYKWLCEKISDLERFMQLLIDFYQCFATMELGERELAMFCAYLLFNSGKKNKSLVLG